jgi:hypothetical protein
LWWRVGKIGETPKAPVPPPRPPPPPHPPLGDDRIISRCELAIAVAAIGEVVSYIPMKVMQVSALFLPTFVHNTETKRLYIVQLYHNTVLYSMVENWNFILAKIWCCAQTQTRPTPTGAYLSSAYTNAC